MWLLHAGTPESMTQPVSMTTLEPRFWSSRGAQDSGAPAIDGEKLLAVLENCAAADTQQDSSAMQVRPQRVLMYRAMGGWDGCCPHDVCVGVLSCLNGTGSKQ